MTRRRPAVPSWYASTTIFVSGSGPGLASASPE